MGEQQTHAMDVKKHSMRGKQRVDVGNKKD